MAIGTVLFNQRGVSLKGVSLMIMECCLPISGSVAEVIVPNLTSSSAKLVKALP